jgi:hypothetical protein
MATNGEIPADTLKTLAGLWSASVEEVPSTAQAPIFGFNLRFNLGKALAAVGATASACVATAGAVAMNPVALIGLPVATFSAVAAALAAVYEKMNPLHYVACIELAKHSEGLTKEQLEKQLQSFFDSADHTKFPWYLGLTKDRISLASQAFKANDGLDDLIKGLKQKKYATEKDGRFSYAVPNFTLGLFPD